MNSKMLIDRLADGRGVLFWEAQSARRLDMGVVLADSGAEASRHIDKELLRGGRLADISSVDVYRLTLRDAGNGAFTMLAGWSRIEHWTSEEYAGRKLGSRGRRVQWVAEELSTPSAPSIGTLHADGKRIFFYVAEGVRNPPHCPVESGIVIAGDHGSVAKHIAEYHNSEQVLIFGTYTVTLHRPEFGDGNERVVTSGRPVARWFSGDAATVRQVPKDERGRIIRVHSGESSMLYLEDRPLAMARPFIELYNE